MLNCDFSFTLMMILERTNEQVDLLWNCESLDGLFRDRGPTGETATTSAHFGWWASSANRAYTIKCLPSKTGGIYVQKNVNVTT